MQFCAKNCGSWFRLLHDRFWKIALRGAERIMSTWRLVICAAAGIGLTSFLSSCESKSQKPAGPSQAAPAISGRPLTQEDQEALFEKELPGIARLSKMYADMEKVPRILQPVEAKKLQELLPEALPDLGRTQFEAKNDNYLEQATPTAHARYEGKGDAAGKTKSIDVSLGDWGIPTNNMAVWAHRFGGPIAKESDKGYEKNYDKDGDRFYEKYTKADQIMLLQVLVADRFLVKIEGQEAPPD